MRKALICLIAGMALAAISAFGQKAREQIQQNPLRAGGVYYMYEFKEHKVTPPPKGYKHVYLSHYGRHGARYLMNATQYERSVGVLAAAHKSGVLTAEGERVWTIASEYFEKTRRHCRQLLQLRRPGKCQQYDNH